MGITINFDEATIRGSVNITNSTNASETVVPEKDSTSDEVKKTGTDFISDWLASQSGEQTHQTKHNWDDDESLMTTVGISLAAIKGVKPEEFEFNLYDWIDPDAIDALITSVDDSIFIGFAIDDYLVTIQNDGQITILEKK